MEYKAAALKHFFNWIKRREEARQGKARNEPKPWTNDPIIQQYRFCNVRRMDDKVSQWLLDNWYDTHQTAHMNLLAACVARLINWPETLSYISGGKPFTEWEPKAMLKSLNTYKAGGNKVFTGAYIINGARGGSKVQQVIENIDCLSKHQMFLSDSVVVTSSMAITHSNIMGFPGLGSFMAGQIVADLRHVVRGAWLDRDTWAPIGPGSRRGMRRLLGKEAAGSMAQEEFIGHLTAVVQLVRNNCEVIYEDRGLEAMDIQNCLCEFDKYMRTINNEGTPRSLYDGVRNQLI